MHENNNILSKFFNKKVKTNSQITSYYQKTNLWTLNAFYVEIPDSIFGKFSRTICTI